MFSAQLEQGRSAEVKEKPPDPNFNVKRSRTLEEYDAGNLRKPGNVSFKSKLLSMSSPGNGDQNEKVAKPPVVSAKDDPYGPWLQVSYGRNMRNNNGPKFAGKRSENGGSFGKMETVNRVESGPSTQGVETSRQDTETRKDAVPRKGLVEISNIERFNRKHLTSPASKYLVSNLGDKSSFNKSLKENVRKGNMKVNKKDKLHVSYPKYGSQSKDMEEDLQDSEVLKILHKEVDISNAGSFDVVASKLKEAMEVAME
ncbi:hypothetical protein Q3G72_016303 [Acer saccharum]|nr:hypothetical protein Q3G72_016303 [Acer saccharum]